MNMTLSPFLSRSLALLLLVSVFAAGWSLVAEPVIDARGAYRQTIARAHELIARYDRVGMHRARLEKRLAEMRSRGRSTTGYLSGVNHSLTTAALQDRIKRIVTVNGGAVRSLQALPPKEDQGLKRLPVRVQFNADIIALQKILHGFEAGELGGASLFLNDVNIRTQRAPRRSRRGSKKIEPGQTNNQELTVSIELYGYYGPEKSR